MTSNNPILRRLNVEKSLALASTLFPGEEWVPVEANIWAAKSRLSEKYKEPDKWAKEMSQVRILTIRGSVAYFLPEKKNEDKGKFYADTVIDGKITELKTVSGNRSTLGTDFKQGYKQGAALAAECANANGHSVYIRPLSDLEVDSVRAKIAGELKNRPDEGHFTCYFERIGKLYTWSYDELRAMIGKR